jgi:bzd-type benzoyl-CoA reductase N subunit
MFVQVMSNSIELKILELFRETNRTFPQTREILQFKNQGGKVFGWLCTYVPEEIILAAGALPIRITGDIEEGDIEEGNAYLYINNCSFSRSCFQLGITGQYDFLDGIAGGSTCDGARRLFDIWRNYINTPFYHVLSVPRKFTPAAHRVYYSQVVKFKEHLEEFLGIQITDEALIKATELCNEMRSLLKQLYELRKLEQPPITGAEIMEVLNASFRMPKELFNDYLKKLLGEIKESGRGFKSQVRLMLVGSVLHNPEFIKSIEGLGSLIVTDELCSSTRYWSDPVILEPGQPPLKSIARRYLNNFPCARMVPSDERFDRIIQLARDFRVDGIISQVIRYCVPYAHDVPLLKDRLKEVNIPMLALDVEYGTSGSGQIRTRVQAFLEMIEAKSK